MKKKGQALVEFVLVFPIFLLIVTTIIELGSINYQRYKLEDNLDTVCEMYRKGNALNDYLKANDLVNWRLFNVAKALHYVLKLMNVLIGGCLTLQRLSIIFKS